LVFDEELRRLSRLYIIDRYPGEMAELSWKEAEDAYAAAQRIKEFVLSEIAKKPAGD
jgi:HEPN domain.